MLSHRNYLMEEVSMFESVIAFHFLYLKWSKVKVNCTYPCQVYDSICNERKENTMLLNNGLLILLQTNLITTEYS